MIDDVARHAQLIGGGELMSLTRAFAALVTPVRVIDRSFAEAAAVQFGPYHK
jgi:hypothetical protein